MCLALNQSEIGIDNWGILNMITCLGLRVEGSSWIRRERGIIKQIMTNPSGDRDTV